MLVLQINDQDIQLLEPIPTELEIEKLTIVNFPIPKPIQPEAGQKIADWIYEITQRVTGVITYNGYPIEKDKVKQYVSEKLKK